MELERHPLSPPEGCELGCSLAHDHTQWLPPLGTWLLCAASEPDPRGNQRMGTRVRLVSDILIYTGTEMNSVGVFLTLFRG